MVEQPPVPVDDSSDPFNQRYGYWQTKKLIVDYFKANLDTTFDRPPSYRKYQRVFELVIGPAFKSKRRLLEVLADIGNNPTNNTTKEMARRVMNSIYINQIKDRDLDNYQFEED